MNLFRIFPPVRGLTFAACAMTALLTASGCGWSGGPTADPIRAEESLKIALEAWKSGASSDELSSRDPAILVIDPDWNAGAGLLEFEAEPARQAGFDVVMPVRLTLSTAKGRKVRRTAVYTISTKPQNLIIRQEG